MIPTLDRFDKKVNWEFGKNFLTVREGLIISLSKANISFLVTNNEIQISADDHTINLYSNGTWELA